MTNLKKLLNKKNIILIPYILIELVLYIIFLKDNTKYTYQIGFVCIVLNYLFSMAYFLINYKDLIKGDSIKHLYHLFITFGLFSTCFADFFLIGIIEFNQSIGMICFSVTQIMYALFIFKMTDNKKLNIIHFVIRFILSWIGMILTIVILNKNVDFVSVISIFYFINLICNIIFSFINKSNLVFSIGLVLFICCDIFIGLQNIDSYIILEQGSLFYKMAHVPFDIAWMFYIPSQAFIALAFPYYKNKTSSRS